MVRERAETLCKSGRYLADSVEMDPGRNPDGFALLYACSRALSCGVAEK
ncbi:MAG: hypothetical protein VB055_10535 [Oscillospiraceae bacterium]|nr:hypothetical protein [Oscillospiraceae bacterium]